MHKIIQSVRKMLKHTTFFGWVVFAALIVIIISLIASTWYSNKRTTKLSEQIITLSDSLSSTTALLEASIADTHSELAEALKDEQQRISSVKDQIGGIQTQFGSITGTVDTLTKLTTTDKELLSKYSKIFFLNENYNPARLIEIPSEYRYYEARTIQIVPEAWPRLQKMIEDAKATGITLYVYSAYRSFDSQETIKDGYKITYGAGTANQFSADQGYSEHQLGTTVDIITTGLNGQLTNAFGDTEAFAWLQTNAHNYGFVLSYPKNNGHYIYEPWHWRFVGVKLTKYLHDNNEQFYDLDQRTIDTYLSSLFD